VEIIDGAFSCKFNVLQRLNRHREALECAKEQYTLWAMNHMRNPNMFRAAFALIQSCIHNKELEDAFLYAHTAHEMVVGDADGIIPSDQRELLIAEGSYWLSQATYRLAHHGRIPPEEKQKAGENAIAAARRSLEIHTKLYGTESKNVAADLRGLADILGHFNDVDDDEVLRLYEQSIAISCRLEGRMSASVGLGEYNFGNEYLRRAGRAMAVNDPDRWMTNMELALPHFHEAARICSSVYYLEMADEALRNSVEIEEDLRNVRAARAADNTASRK